MTSPIRRTGQFNRMSFYTHIEHLKNRIRSEGGDKAEHILPVLIQLQKDIDGWTVGKRYKRAYSSISLQAHEWISSD